MRFKPDASFFRKIVIGAVGANAVCKDLNQHGYELVELERGATDTKIWKDVKRKRVRIPDLVCVKTGVRIESRAKTKPSLQMSHSPEEAERAWDYGMVDDDWIAFPICVSVEERSWSDGSLVENVSYFRQRQWERFQVTGAINYFKVGEFRSIAHSGGRRKGVVEASEYSIEWEAKFSTRSGPVRYVEYDDVKKQYKVCIENAEGNAYTWRVDDNLNVVVSPHCTVLQNQAFASAVPPITPSSLVADELNSNDLHTRFLISNERTMRFTGVKIARLREDRSHIAAIRNLANDPEEDLYVRLEALTYQAAVGNEPVYDLFERYLNSDIEQDALEAVICVGEVGTEAAVNVLHKILSDRKRPYFLRSAAAWALGHVKLEHAQEVLIQTFSDEDTLIREEALGGLISLGTAAVPALLNGLQSENDDIAAGCSEALRQYQRLQPHQLEHILTQLCSADPSNWAVWLIGNLPEPMTSAKIASLQDLDPKIHYCLSLLWSFSRSWIAQHWEKAPRPIL